MLRSINFDVNAIIIIPIIVILNTTNGSDEKFANRLPVMNTAKYNFVTYVIFLSRGARGETRTLTPEETGT
jgi:hypothetical protein